MAQPSGSKRKKNSKTRKNPGQLPGQPEWFSNTRLHCLIFFLLSFLLYSNTLRHNYTQDDAIVIYDNMFTTKGLKGIPGILKYDTFFGFFKEEGKANLVAGGRYRPLSLIMYSIEVQLFASKKTDAQGNQVYDQDGDAIFDPNENGALNAIKFVGHLVNVLLFGLISIMLYLLILKLLGTNSKGRFIALAASLIFIVHPTHTEVVANIKGRDEILALLLSITAAYYSLRAFREDKLFLNLFAGFFFFLGLLAKENSIAFLGVVPLIYYFFTNARFSRIGIQTIPFLISAIVFLGLRGMVLNQTAGGVANLAGTAPTELMNNPFLKIEGNQYVPFTESERLATICYTLGKYVLLLFVPHPLTHDYYPRHIDKMSWGEWQVLLSLILHLGLLAYAIMGLKRKEPVSFGILYYLGTLFLVSNIMFPVGTNMAERFLFMPSVGFCLVLSILAWRLAKQMASGHRITNFSSLYKVIGLLAAIIFIFGIKTFFRNPVWKDNFTLFTTDIETSANSAKLRNSVGGELVETFKNSPNETERKIMLGEAIVHLKEAARIHPNYKNAYLIMGNAYNYLQEYENSIKAYQKALQIDPEYSQARQNLGITYRDAGKYFGEKEGDLKKALQYLMNAESILGNEPETLRLLGVAYGMSGNNQKAIAYFQKLVEVQPNNASALWNLANAYRFAGDSARELEYRQKARQIDPNIEQQFRQQ